MRRETGVGLAQGLAAALWVGLVASGVDAALHALLFARPWLVIVPLWEHAMLPFLGCAAAALALAALSFRALRGWIEGERWRARAALLLPVALAAVALYAFVCTRLLLESSAREKLAWSAVLVLALCLLGELLLRALLAWRGARRGGVLLAGVLSGLLGMGALLVHARLPRAPGPHVFVLLVDVLRADHLGCYGYERATSPNIDRFARDAVLFEEAVSQSTFTKTSVASLFTGLYPHHHGVYDGNLEDDESRITSDVLGRQFTTLAEALGGGGYLTLGLVHNHQLRGYMGFDQGYDLYDDRAGALPAMARDLRWLCDAFAGQRRLFAYLHMLDLHGPYRPGPAYARRFGRFSDRYDHMDIEQWRAHFRAVQHGTETLSPDDARELEALYDAQLVFVDEWIGRVLEDLRAAGLYDESLIVFTADHGEGFLEHGFISHSTTPFEELVHVPLLVKLPRSRNAGARIREPAALIDLFPTLLELAGREVPFEHDGQSLLAELTAGGDGAHAPRQVISEYKRSVAVREGRWKWIDDPGGRGQALYDLDSDPSETRDRQAEFADVAHRLALRALAVQTRRHELGEGPRVFVDEETQAELRALGYL